jgi:uncharacterized protein (TIGR02996 family)
MSEDGFIAAVLEDPSTDVPRLVYADWLEDHGDPRGEFLRVECQLLNLPSSDERIPAPLARLQELHRTLDPEWVALVRRLPLDPLDELRSVLPPPRRSYQAVGDWAAVEAALGTRLPADYKVFIAVYGSGVINGCLEIYSPLGREADIRRWWANWAAVYHSIAEYVEVPYPIFPQPGGLLPFATLGDVDTLNWLTAGEPDCWPFVYHNRSTMQRCSASMTS